MIWPSAYSQQHEILGYALHIVSSNTKGKQREEKKIKTPNKQNPSKQPKTATKTKWKIFEETEWILLSQQWTHSPASVKYIYGRRWSSSCWADHGDVELSLGFPKKTGQILFKDETALGCFV